VFIMAYEIQERVGCEVRVLNAAKLPFIWDAPTKTYRDDAADQRSDEAGAPGGGAAEGISHFF
jgi:hypothetical protein